jgi:hypothetical protein
MHADHRLGAVLGDQVESVLGHQVGIGARVGEHELDLPAKNAAAGIHLLRRQHRARLTRRAPQAGRTAERNEKSDAQAIRSAPRSR